MKRQFIPLVIILPVVSLFFSLKIYAQSGTGELPGAKPTPTPKPATRGPKTAAPAAPAAAPVSSTLTVGEERKGKLDPKSSDKSATGSLYEELILNARSEDLLTFSLETGNPTVALQILDKDNAEVTLARNHSGEFKINSQTGGLPDDGEYRVRVAGQPSGNTAVPFAVQV